MFAVDKTFPEKLYKQMWVCIDDLSTMTTMMVVVLMYIGLFILSGSSTLMLQAWKFKWTNEGYMKKLGNLLLKGGRKNYEEVL